MTTISPARASSRRALAAGLAAIALAGCVYDTASYRLADDGDQSIVLARRQDWFWQDSGRLAVTVSRLPECQGGSEIEDVPLAASYELYQAPPDYPEAILILKIGARHFALGTESCRVQEFDETPPDLGRKLGVFAERNGKFSFQPAGG